MSAKSDKVKVAHKTQLDDFMLCQLSTVHCYEYNHAIVFLDGS